MNKQLIKEFNLPGYIKNKTFAEASKAISKKFDERTDPQAQKTKEELLERLAEAQEYVKMQEDAKMKSMQSSMDNNATEVEDQMNGQIPEGMEEFMPKVKGNKMAMGGPIDPPSNDKTNKQIEAYQGVANKINQFPDDLSTLDDESLKSGFRDSLWLSRAKFPGDASSAPGGTDDYGYMAEKINQELQSRNKVSATNENKNGGLIKRKDGSYSKRGLWDNIRANKGSGKKPTSEMLKQEKKINSKSMGGLLDKIQAAAGGKGEAMKTVDGVEEAMAKSGGMGKVGAYVDGADQLLDMSKDIFGDNGIDTSGNGKYQEDINEGGAAASGALKGATTGAQIGGPVGAGVGTVVGGVGSLFGAKSKNKDIKEANQNKALADNSKLSNNTFSKGGYTKAYKEGGFIPNALIQPDTIEYAKEIKANQTNAKTSDINNDSGLGNKIKEFGSKYGADLGRISPTVFNLIRAGNLDKAEQVRRKTLDNKYDTDYVDVNQMINKIDQNNVNKALSESSGGDLGALRSNILAANLNKDKAKSDAYIKAEQINRGENRTKQQFDTSIDKLNLSQSNADLVDNMQNRGARETAKNNLMSSAMTDIGRMSKEVQDRKIASETTGYTWDGEYVTDGENKVSPEDLGLTEKDGNLVDENGNKVSKEELQRRIQKNKK